MQVRLLTKTFGVEGTEYYNHSIDEVIVGLARLSSSRDVNTLFDNPSRLLRHCLLEGHWSIFNMANLTFEIKTSRAMGRELLRHGAHVGLQEFSQRYAEATIFEPIELRRQSKSNRQSTDEIFVSEEEIHDGLTAKELVNYSVEESYNDYLALLEAGVGKECARFVLPETTQTTLNMNFRVRELITMLNVRLHKTAQKEIRLVAESLKDVFIQECPVISEALFNFEHAYDVHVLDQLILEKYGFRNSVINN